MNQHQNQDKAAVIVVEAQGPMHIDTGPCRDDSCGPMEIEVSKVYRVEVASAL